MLSINQPLLTPEQIKLIPEYRQKWQQAALNRASINRDRAITAVNNIYDFLELNQPQIIFFTNPNAALEHIYREISDSWGRLENSSLKKPIASQMTQKLIGNLNSQLKGEVYTQLQGNLDNNRASRLTQEIAEQFTFDRIFSIIWTHAGSYMLSSANNSQTDELTKALFNLFLSGGFIFNRYISSPLGELQQQVNQFFGGSTPVETNNFAQMYEVIFTGKFTTKNERYQLPQIELSSNMVNVLVPSVMADYAYYIDYLHQVVNCDRDSLKWSLFEDLIVTCGWIFPYEQTVLICDRTF